MRRLFSASEGPCRLFACLMRWLATQPSSRAAGSQGLTFNCKKISSGKKPRLATPLQCGLDSAPAQGTKPLPFASSSHEARHGLNYEEFKLATCIFPSCSFSVRPSVSHDKGCVESTSLSIKQYPDLSGT